MPLDPEVQILIRLVRRYANSRGAAPADQIREWMGPSFIGAWNKAYNSGLLARGGERHLLSLSRLGAAMA